MCPLALCVCVCVCVGCCTDSCEVVVVIVVVLALKLRPLMCHLQTTTEGRRKVEINLPTIQKEEEEKEDVVVIWLGSDFFLFALFLLFLFLRFLLLSASTDAESLSLSLLFFASDSKCHNCFGAVFICAGHCCTLLYCTAQLNSALLNSTVPVIFLSTLRWHCPLINNEIEIAVAALKQMTHWLTIITTEQLSLFPPFCFFRLYCLFQLLFSFGSVRGKWGFCRWQKLCQLLYWLVCCCF